MCGKYLFHAFILSNSHVSYSHNGTKWQQVTCHQNVSSRMLDWFAFEMAAGKTLVKRNKAAVKWWHEGRKETTQTYHRWLSAHVGFRLTASSPTFFPERKGKKDNRQWYSAETQFKYTQFTLDILVHMTKEERGLVESKGALPEKTQQEM